MLKQMYTYLEGHGAWGILSRKSAPVPYVPASSSAHTFTHGLILVVLRKIENMFTRNNVLLLFSQTLSLLDFRVDMLLK
jgi:hypothetical protein